MSRHVVLLGDAVFDNGSYTAGGPDVLTHLRAMIPGDWAVTPCAKDGAVTADIEEQLEQLPAGATDLVLSVGGNDGLHSMNTLTKKVATTFEAMLLLHGRIEPFEDRYLRTVEGVLARGIPLTVCTVYNGNFAEPQAAVIKTGVRLFNSVILGAAVARNLGVIDLCTVCTQPEDFFGPVELSSSGGHKVAKAVLDILNRRGGVS
jgi:hypothetical protein